MPVSLHPMTISDYDEVVALWKRCEGLGDAEPRDEFQFFLDRNPGCSIIARDDGRVVGAIQSGHDGRRGYLYHVAVDPECRNLGIARKMIDECLHIFAELGIRRCSIHIYANNQTGIDFWAHNGWRERTDLLVMAKDLV